MKKIVIAGPDGCGKSTLIRTLAKEMESRGHSVTLNSPWDGMRLQKTFTSKSAIMDYLKQLPDLSRLLFILHGLILSMEQALKQKSDFLLIYSYWYKFFLVESKIQNSVSLRPYFNHLPEPDKVYFLRTPLSVITARKQSHSYYECGGAVPSRENFSDFQHSLHQAWERFVTAQHSWSVLCGLSNPERICQIIMSEENLPQKGVQAHGTK